MSNIQIRDYKVNTLPLLGQPNSRYYVLAEDNTAKEYITDRFGNFRLIAANGSDGTDGLSAYQIAVQNGYVGTEVEWLLSLQAPPPSSIGGTYTHQQAIPDSIWTILHNLGFNPNVSVVDSAEQQVQGTIKYINLNTLTVEFSFPFSGTAYLS